MCEETFLLSGCIVVDGDDAGSECVFPYVLGRSLYKECSIVNATDQRPWCPTEVSRDIHIFD